MQIQADYINKFYISLKEANETNYWLNLLKDTGYIDENNFTRMEKDNNELIAMLVATVKTLKSKLKK